MNHKTNLGIRAVLHTARKWKKTLLVFFLLLAITTLVMSGLAIADAQEEQSEELRGVTGASFTVNANNGYTLQPVTDEMSEEDFHFCFVKPDGELDEEASPMFIKIDKLLKPMSTEFLDNIVKPLKDLMKGVSIGA